MTIRQFASLCGCNPQTLRYYDRVGLLKPVQVDRWSGYRYYDEEQALAFVKIKNLQRAGFSIEEIRELLDRDNQAIFRAFEAKIAEAEERLREMKEIQKSYQSEMSEIREKIDMIREKLFQAMNSYDPQEEFGIGAEEYGKIVSDISDMFEEVAVSEPDQIDYQEEATPHDYLHDPDYELVYEKHGWRHVKEFLDEFSELREDGTYALIFRVDKSRWPEPEESSGMAFANTLLCVLLNRNPGRNKTFSCDIESSEDGINHFWFLKKRS